MRNHTCLLDHHQRSHYDTITIGPEVHLGSAVDQQPELFDGHEEKFNTQRSPNQPNQSQNQSVIDQGNLRTRKVCLLLKVKRPVPMRSMKKVFTKNSVLQMAPGFTFGGGIVTVVSVYPAQRCTSPLGVVPVGLRDGVGDCHDVANFIEKCLFVSLLFLFW